MSGSSQIGSHGHAHISKPDESDLHAGLPCLANCLARLAAAARLTRAAGKGVKIICGQRGELCHSIAIWHTRKSHATERKKTDAHPAIHADRACQRANPHWRVVLASGQGHRRHAGGSGRRRAVGNGRGVLTCLCRAASRPNRGHGRGAARGACRSSGCHL